MKQKIHRLARKNKILLLLEDKIVYAENSEELRIHSQIINNLANLQDTECYRKVNFFTIHH